MTMALKQRIRSIGAGIKQFATHRLAILSIGLYSERGFQFLPF